MPQYGLDTTQYALSGVPVGTILPFVGIKASLPGGWMACDGSTVQDVESWFNGQAVPNLEGFTYLTGVSAAAEVNEPHGSNEIIDDGSHSHGGSTQIEGKTGRRDANGMQSQGDECEFHIHGITSDGTHKHGGDKRPKSVGVWFIIRIK